jgi:glutamate 5-kinase
LVSQIAFLKEMGKKIVLVSSGAVAFGRQEIKLSDKVDPVLRKQIWASSGQIDLIQTYKKLFSEKYLQIAQVLVTKEDFRDRKHYLHMKNCVQGLLNQGIVPVINENDTVAITELMFTDNDELAGLTAAMINADSLILLTNVDGIFDGPPQDPNSKLIPYVGQKVPELENFVSTSKSSFGRGGMLTKLSMAKKSAELGIQVFIANGKKENILLDFHSGNMRCTYFEPKSFSQGRKKWLAHGDHYYKGEVVISEGAKAALFSGKISSLLPIGILSISGEFVKGEIIRILDENSTKLGLGRAEYPTKTALEKIGQKNQKPFIHYDYLYLFNHE